ncbi:hypothetical protein ICN46_05645 [Polynucleobacter sp. Latsch14-2]|jgi:hypothetical protein|uniref:hypothetical protein n=1 Tax=Polynucleobacter sp. Latsch14-2 TaxID=2576920 RepID=UPI001C0DC623|nr:hypothetical protein [Polynucleobacter sp. Latsch14-2]MBU3614376.1 hypothetical protein [Polynucleobacter sp. Latsch14-2]
MTIKVRDKLKNTESGKSKKATSKSVEKEVFKLETDVMPPRDSVTGQGLFIVHILENSVSVESAFLADDGNMLRMPAVFPNRGYALEQVDELRNIINRNFDEIEGKSKA